MKGPRLNDNNSIYDQSILSNTRGYQRFQTNESVTRSSTNTLINDENNASFEDEDEDDDEHSHTIDQVDASHPVPTHNAMIHKAQALYDFNGQN